VGVAAAELDLVGPGDPVQEPAGVVGAGVGAHEVEDRAGMVDEVVGQSDGRGEGVAADRLGPAIAEVAGQVEEGGEAAGGAGELGGPAGQVGQIPASGGQPRLQVAFEGEQQLAGLWVEDEDGWVVAGRAGQAGGQRLELEGVAVGDRLGDGRSAGLAAADQAWRKAVQEPGQQSASSEAGSAG
jgi:hypothetical protein